MKREEYLMFPYDRIKKGSKVILYGGGTIGKYLYWQNKISQYCTIVAIIDKNICEIDGIRSITPENILTIPFDSILVCANWRIIEEISQILILLGVDDKKIVFLGESDKMPSVKIDFSPNPFQNILTENMYRHISLQSNPEMFQWKRNNKNHLHKSQAISDMLLIGYKYINPVFHIVDDNKEYIGTIDKEIITGLSSDDISPDMCLGELCTVASQKNMKIFIDSKVEDSVYQIYKKFEGDKHLIEIPIVSDGKLVDALSRVDFEAHFSKYDFNRNTPYITYRFPPCRGSLNKYACSVHSQWGEDGIIEKIFEMIGFESKFAVEFGGWDGIFLSNIRCLIIKNNFSAIFIEGDAKKAEKGKSNYKDNAHVKFVTEYVGFKTHKNLDTILHENSAPNHIDILSIDIDGFDYHVWDSFIDYRPRVVIIEYNPMIPNDVIFINPKSEDKFIGSSAAAMVELGRKKGYSLAAITDTNCIFVVDEEFDKLTIADNTLETMRSGFIRSAYLHSVTFENGVYNEPYERYNNHII